MADASRNFSNQPLDLKRILEVAQHRWLRPAEICEILRNHHKFYLAPKPSIRPPGGSVFLFDRKVLRYFRKDGHSWRKKKDGKTVNEAHEKLKEGSIDVLHCYYAHGEDNENFQRRSYWMLEEQLEHIVLVHYREVKEGYRVSASRLQSKHPVPQLENPQSSSTPPFESGLIVQETHTSRPSSVAWKEQALSSDVFCGNYKENEEDPLLMPASGHFFPINSSFSSENQTGLAESSRHSFQLNTQFGSFMPTDIHSSDRNSNVTVQQKLYSGHLKVAELLSNKLTYARLDAGKAVKDVANSRNRLAIVSGEVLEENILVSSAQTQNISGSQTVVAPDAAVQNSSLEGGVNGDEAGSLKKLYSFGRWMDRGIGGDCDESLMASDSAIYWNSLDTDNGDKYVSSLSRRMQLDIDSLSQEQLFSISDFAPDWVYAGVETKVLIIGTFLGHGKHPTCQKWSCMFGEVEVSAEVLTRNIIRCQIPSHAPGRVPFYVTCSNRLACSEVREFEYRKKTSELAPVLRPSDEVCLQVRLAKLLYSRLNRKFLDCSIEECEKCKLKTLLCSLKCETGNASEGLDDLLAITEGNHINFRDVLIQNFMKDKLHEWLVSRAHKEDKGPNILDDEGQGVIHLVAALGYEWGLLPLISAGVSPNFRDARGRTALHWAAHYGREDMVIALVKLGVAAGAVDDPTVALPGGQTAADLASSRGHKGIAGYLAESDLTHLQSLVINNNALDNISSGREAEKAFESAAPEVVPLNETIHDDFCLKESLASVRKSAHAAALIQAAFRARSFRQRQLTESRNNVSEALVDLVALGSLNKVQKVNHFEDYLHSAAIKIQHKYRGWKGRREFLKIRNRIVKVQAHVRGHQVRKQYKKFVWSVSIVEKAILRWRRKKPGLRGFQQEITCQNGSPEFGKNDEYEFLSIGRKQKFAGVEKALTRVQSMVRHPEARDQYMRLVAKFEGSKLDDRGTSK